MLEQIKEKLTRAGIQFVRFQYCDNANIVRAKAVPIDRLEHFSQYGVGLTKAAQAQPAMFDTVVANPVGLSPVGEVRLMPDWSSLQLLPYSTKHASVMCAMHDQGAMWEYCPRGFLNKMVAMAKDAGIELKMGQEFEFILLKHASEECTPSQPSDSCIYAESMALDLSADILERITESLSAQDIGVNLVHAESAPGQFEISLQHTDVLQCADQNVWFRQTVKAIAAQSGFVASFLPKPYEESAGSGCHLNVSLWRKGKNIFCDPSKQYALSEEAQCFMAGVLCHLPAIMAVTAPSVNSYRRFLPHYWSGAFGSWGEQNREAALRLAGFDQSPTRFELKTMDASANPYLALGVVIAAGMDGVVNKMQLPPPCNQDPGLLSEQQRKQRNIYRLPTTLFEALAEYKSNDMLKASMGENLQQAFQSVRQAEWDYISGLSFDEEVKLLLNRY
ncbi:glutamine synthetase family protein [Vibrio sp. S4M6]|uniref:glutamine synthetase family protein n=1 Tax=Vibrio sinus TaxID=2946865 RepID=UPI00202A0E4C|nr:glutamine synthetase family protein [Vibrio sinus]MCL9780956.1 glutamine synthetase family protein [Vibrio sinus]